MSGWPASLPTYLGGKLSGWPASIPTYLGGKASGWPTSLPTYLGGKGCGWCCRDCLHQIDWLDKSRLFQKIIDSCQCFCTHLKTCVVAIDLESNNKILDQTVQEHSGCFPFQNHLWFGDKYSGYARLFVHWNWEFSSVCWFAVHILQCRLLIKKRTDQRASLRVDTRETQQIRWPASLPTYLGGKVSGWPTSLPTYLGGKVSGWPTSLPTYLGGKVSGWPASLPTYLGGKVSGWPASLPTYLGGKVSGWPDCYCRENTFCGDFDLRFESVGCVSCQQQNAQKWICSDNFKRCHWIEDSE